LGLLQADAGERQRIEPLVGEFGDLLFGPLPGVSQIGREVIDDGVEGGAVPGFYVPQVHAVDLGNAADTGERLQVEGGIPKRFGAGLFARSAAIGADLARKNDIAVMSESELLIRRTFYKAGDRRGLRGPPGSVVVARVLFVIGILAVGQPVQIFFKPLMSGGLILRVPLAGA